MKNIYFLIRPSYQRIAFLVLCILMVTVPESYRHNRVNSKSKDKYWTARAMRLLGLQSVI